ncbi:mechanosensitive ion channel [Pseudothauera nasutitermitis]|uniref:Mechanosensitive ion channel n=1 Tax=Pseudothauera nasutitermitis TaxID=2565930 RepID=A0A4V3WB08_9RHOO|nr:mechanosensitive ion channel domain-containing protein [Pseudothauera nasutitermitis]THF61455.1 mechanosensitive ion channel [Pseudothauera nasutitermitis]
MSVPDLDSPQFAALLFDIRDDFRDPAVLWQIGVLALCLLAAWWLARRARVHLLEAHRDELNAARRFGREGLLRVVFPLAGLILVVLAREVLDQFHSVKLFNLAVPLLGSMAVIRLVAYALREAVGRTSWLAGFERIFASLVWGVVALHIVGWLPRVVGALESVALPLGGQRLSLWTLLQGTAMVLLTVLVALWAAGLLERRLSAAARLDQGVRQIVLRVAKSVLVLVAILIALPMVGIDLTTLSVFGGALGVGLGFGMQKIAASYVSGFIILFDRSIRIGNQIAVGSERGVVREITTRYTVLRASNGMESLVPNETLIGSVVQNDLPAGVPVALSLQFPVAYGADVERAMAVLVEVAGAQGTVLADPAPRSFLAAFGDNGILLQLNCSFAGPRGNTLAVTSAINLEVWRRFEREGIPIPRPQREIRLLPAEGELPPFGAVSSSSGESN